MRAGKVVGLPLLCCLSCSAACPALLLVLLCCLSCSAAFPALLLFLLLLFLLLLCCRVCFVPCAF
jgi:hypothetical protein